MAPKDKALIDLKVAIDRRARLFQRLQVAYDLRESLADEAVASHFKERCRTLDDTQNEFENNQDAISQLNCSVDAENRITDLPATSKAFEDLYFRLKVMERKLLQREPVPEPAITTIVPPMRPKLPQIHIPVFDGSYENFSSFRSLFDTLIHKQAGLTVIEKYSYLKSLVSKSALSAIQGFPFSEESYKLAYDTLIAQFSNKRVIANTLCTKLFELKPISHQSQLRNFLEQFNVCVESLKAVEIDDFGDFLLLFMGLRLLDPTTRQAFEKSWIGKDAVPEYKELLKFIQGQVSVVELMNPSNKVTSKGSASQPAQFKSSHFVSSVSRSSSSHATSGSKKSSEGSLKCPCCAKSHTLSICEKFGGLTVAERYNVLRERKLCFACLGPHPRNQCTSKFSCRVCGSKVHHTLLHVSSSSQSLPVATSSCDVSLPTPAPVPSLSCGVVPNLNIPQVTKQVLLGTAVVTVCDVFGNPHNVRVLIDPGSMVTIMTQSLSNRLCLPTQTSNVRITGIGSNNVQPCKGIVSCHLSSQHSIFTLPIKAVVLPSITGNIPSSPVAQQVIDRLSSHALADPFFCQPSAIDILLGAEYYCSVIDSDSAILPGEPYLVPSKFGHLVLGLAESASACTVQRAMFVASEDELVTQLRKFWEIEEVSVTIPADPNDAFCEEHFQRTTRRDESGRYIVRLPFRNEAPPDLGNNRAQALLRLHRLERSLDRNPLFKELYHANLQDYIDSGHMVESKNPSDYVLIHHGVLKESSSTTKVRVVFSPAEKSTPYHLSLNEALLPGPKLQNDIADLVLNFRLNPIALTADIKQMYLGIKLDAKDSPYQQIFWRKNSGEPVKQYEIQKVCFGVTSSPFHALRVLKQLISDEGSRFPNAAKVVETDTYIDDICTGSASIDEARQLRNGLTEFLSTAGFELRKWSCSHPEVLKDLPLDFLEKPHKMGDIESIRVLGLQWDPKNDSFIYSVDPISNCHTKRQVLSQIARIYDLSGFLSPITVWMKILLQRLWVRGLDWDEPVPADLLCEWNNFISDMSALLELRIPRYVLDTFVFPPELVGFADASTVAMGACIYLRVLCSDERVLLNLVRAKSRVAPLKTCTVPRLELCAAHLLAQTLESLEPLRKRLNINSIYLFSDSMVFLSWLKTPPHLLKIFVANRIVKILEVTTPSQWNHISTDLNPADLASRGCVPGQLVRSELWWSGPPFLRDDPSSWPHRQIQTVANLPDLREISTSLVAQLAAGDEGVTFIERFSSLTAAKRVTAWILRFKSNAKLAKENRNFQTLSVAELKIAERVIIRITQSHYLSGEIAAVSQGKRSTMFRSLTPFLDGDLLRVGGRLAQAPVPYDTRHPIILPAKCHLAKLIVEHYHKTSLHGGNKIVHCLVQRSYYIPRLRELVRKTIFNCTKCIRFVAQPNQPFMSNLPVSRFAQGRPFIHTGVDLAGPYPLKDGSRRNSPINKCYFAVFVCFATKAIHLELLSSLSTDCFFAAFDRFIARRGLPTAMFSDRGTNFIGASRVLDETFQFLRAQENVLRDYLVGREVQWTFNAPANPSAGGLWEAGVKSVKHHLKRLLSDRPLLYEELSTLLSRIEAILNSRPIGIPASCPIDEISCLTPGHFLIGAPLLSRPETDISEVPPNRVPRWDLLRQISQHFWRRWAQEYLQSLIHRQKWWEKIENVKVGDIVVVMVENQPPTKWPLARITALLPAKDGVVRVVSLRTATGALTRPVRKLLVLPTLP